MPNTTNSSNSQYIDAGELALNLADGKLYTSNGSSVIDLTGSGGGGVTVSDTAPSSPTNGALWYYSSDAQLYVYYTDIDGSQWVTATGGGGINNANNALLANNASYLGGVAAANYLQTGSSASLTAATLTVSGNVTISNTRISANGSTGTAGQVLTSAGSSANAYWSTPAPGLTTGKSIAMAIVFGG